MLSQALQDLYTFFSPLSETFVNKKKDNTFILDISHVHFLEFTDFRSDFDVYSSDFHEFLRIIASRFGRKITFQKDILI